MEIHKRGHINTTQKSIRLCAEPQGKEVGGADPILKGLALSLRRLPSEYFLPTPAGPHACLPILQVAHIIHQHLYSGYPSHWTHQLAQTFSTQPLIRTRRRCLAQTLCQLCLLNLRSTLQYRWAQ